MTEVQRRLTSVEDALAILRCTATDIAADVPNASIPLTMVSIHCGCSELSLMCHVVYPEQLEDGSLQVHWDQATIDYLRRHITEHHA